MKRFGALMARCGTSPSSVPATKSVPDFLNSQVCYAHKSILEIFFTLAVLRVCRISYVNKHGIELMAKTEKILGRYFTYNVLVRRTMFRQFCAGEDTTQIKPTLKSLDNLGIGFILDYAAEADDTPNSSVSSMTYNKQIKYTTNDTKFDANMKLYLSCAVDASLNIPTFGVAFAAVKLSGLCDPQLLLKVSGVLLVARQSWVKFFTDELAPPLEECRVVVGVKIKNTSRYATRERVSCGIRKMSSQPVSEGALLELLDVLDPEKCGVVDYLHYSHVALGALNSTSPNPVLAPIMKELLQLSQKEQEMYEALIQRIEIIVTVAHRINVRVMIDAEQTFYQMAIDHIVRNLQRKFNIREPIVYNTYQCYLTFMADRLENDLARASKEGWIWAGKMVRGAYINQEVTTAQQYSYISPVWNSIDDTHLCYNNCAHRILDEIEKKPDKPLGVLFGTHNVQSLKIITDRVLQMGPHKGNISFAQLLGMADNLTVPLAKAGFAVFKYVPYGPVKETIHYLSRRAQENSDIIKGGSAEVRMLLEELQRRFSFR